MRKELVSRLLCNSFSHGCEVMRVKEGLVAFTKQMIKQVHDGDYDDKTRTPMSVVVTTMMLTVMLSLTTYTGELESS